MAQIRLERRGGWVLKGVGRDIGIAIRSVGAGNGLAETDNGERLILEEAEVCQNLGVVNCHIYVLPGSCGLIMRLLESLFTSA